MIPNASHVIPDGTPTKRPNDDNPYDLEYLYVIIPADYNDKNKPLMGPLVYKVGKTNRLNFDRVKSYGKGANLLMQIRCNNATSCERAVLHDLRNNPYICSNSRGNEYFTTQREDIIIDTIVYHARRSIGCIDNIEAIYLLGIDAIVVTGKNKGFIKDKNGWTKKNNLKLFLLKQFNKLSSAAKRRGIDIDSILDGKRAQISIKNGIPLLNSCEIENGVYVCSGRSLIFKYINALLN